MLSLFISFSEWIYQRTKGFTLLAFLVLEIAFAGVLLPYMQLQMGDDVSTPKPLDLYFGFHPEEVYTFLTSLSHDGRQVYLFIEAVIDIVYPLIYTSLFVLAISYFYKRAFSADSSLRLLNLFPLLTLLADFTENAGIVVCLLNFPLLTNGAAYFASIGNYVKWGSSVICLLILLVGIGAWCVKLIGKAKLPEKDV
jgi:hypothetical protein